MKQQITKEQWDELSDKQQTKFFITVNISVTCLHLQNPCGFTAYTPTIGQMIEFLGDDWDKKIRNRAVIRKDFSYTLRCGDNNPMPFNKDLCDALWEVVKDKLNSLK